MKITKEMKAAWVRSEAEWATTASAAYAGAAAKMVVKADRATKAAEEAQAEARVWEKAAKKAKAKAVAAVKAAEEAEAKEASTRLR